MLYFSKVKSQRINSLATNTEHNWCLKFSKFLQNTKELTQTHFIYQLKAILKKNLSLQLKTPIMFSNIQMIH